MILYENRTNQWQSDTLHPDKLRFKLTGNQSDGTGLWLWKGQKPVSWNDPAGGERSRVEAEDIPLRVEAIPLSSESIMFIVTKVEDTEELDTRFSKFHLLRKQNRKIFYPSWQMNFWKAPGIWKNFWGKMDLLAWNRIGTAAEIPGTDEAKAPQIQLRTFRFDSLDQVSEAAKAAGNSCDDIHNALYKKPSTRQYYLVLNNADCNELDFSRVCNVLAEYAAKLPNEYAKEAYYKEHYEVMIGEKALQKLKNL